MSYIRARLGTAAAAAEFSGTQSEGHLRLRRQSSASPDHCRGDTSDCASHDLDVGSLVKIEALEKRIWSALDAVAALRMKVRRTRYSLPLGLLQLRPPPNSAHHPGIATGASSPSGSTYRQGLASDGLDVCAAAVWPVLRRADRLSWAVAATLVGSEDKVVLQQLLECRSLEARLESMLALVTDQKSALSVLADVRRTTT